MDCKQYEEWDVGRLDGKRFRAHAQDCVDCQRHLHEDERLMALARSHQGTVEAPRLWLRIEKTLRDEQSHAYSWTPWIWKAAAVLLVGLGLGYALYRPTAPAPSGLLTDSALAQIEHAEREYIEAIAQLELQAQAKLSQLDPDLSLLYREKLDAISEQVELCREATEENPANAHVRRYLLAALQDKNSTLKELMEYETPVQLTPHSI